MIAVAIASLIPAGAKAAQVVQDALKSKKSPWTTPCPGQPTTDEVVNMLARISADDMHALRATWRLYPPADTPELPVNSPYDMAKHAMGGSDCKITSGKTQFQEAFLRLVRKYNGGGGLQDLTERPDSAWDRAKRAVSGAVGDLKDAGVSIASGVVEGAVSGASASAKGAAKGAQAGSFFTSTAFTVGAVAAAAFAAVLLIRRR